jgi:putative peptidoglycan lipid II flippase
MNLLKSIATISGFTMISRVTGFIRDILIANFLGASIFADAFFVALKFPNLFRRFFAEGAFNAAFVPLYSGTLEEEGQKQADKFSCEAFSILFYVLLGVVIFMEITMPYMIYLLAPGFAETEGKLELACYLSRITFPFLGFISIVSMQSGILNSHGKFAAPASTPVILNLTMIISVFAFTPFLPSTAHALSFGVAIAGFFQFLWLLYHLKKINCSTKLLWIKKISKKTKLLLKRIVPGIMGAGIYQLNLAIDTILVSMVAEGAVSWLYYANRLNQLPLGVIGAAVGTALLPVLSKQIKSDNIDEANQTQNKAIEFSMLITIPATIGLIILAVPIVSILFEHGAFTSTETKATSAALIAFSFGLPAYVLAKVLAPNFFARGDTKTPVKIASICLITNIVLCLILMKPFGHIGIASATSISAWISTFMYAFILKKNGFISVDKSLNKKIKAICLSGFIMGLFLSFALVGLDFYLQDWLHLGIFIRFFMFFSLVICGAMVFFITGNWLKAYSIKELRKHFRK